MGSTRLPGKVMLNLGNSSVLSHVIRRVRAIGGVHDVVVATTTRDDDDRIESEAKRDGAKVFRGSEDDVLDRYLAAATAADAKVVIRITADCPLLDPELVGGMLSSFLQARSSGAPYDYMSNGLRRTFPRGLDAEVFTIEALDRAHREATQPYEREHVTPFIYQHPQLFRIHSFEGVQDLSWHRWTLDTEEDYLMLKRLFDGMDMTAIPVMNEVLRFIGSHPEVAMINAGVRQKSLGN
jgi:spore coat polysaccharide biosynthesis protein SpsF